MSSEWLGDCELSCGGYLVGIDDLCGTGVIIGFVGGAFIANVFLVLDDFLAYDPAIFIVDAASVNPVDARVLKSVRIWARARLPNLALRLERNHDHLIQSLGEANLNMCDLQVLTGLGILIAGFIALPVLKGAHWQMGSYLAWFATVTHLSGLSKMSKHLHGRAWERKLRVVFMGILLIVLIVAMVPIAAITITQSDGGEDLVLTWNCDASCFFSPQFISNNFHSVSLGFVRGDTMLMTQTVAQFGSTIMAMVLMCFSFIVRLGRITPTLLTATKSKRADVSARVQGMVQRMADRQFSKAWQEAIWQELLARPFLCIFLLLRTWILVLSSMLFEIIWVSFLALCGLSRILQVSTQFYTEAGALNPDADYMVHGYNAPRGDYRGGSWSFGQIMPVFLLLAPVVGFLRSTFPNDSAALHPAIYAAASNPESDLPQWTTNAQVDALSQGGLQCLIFLDKYNFGTSQIAKHALVFNTVLASSLMAWFLGELFLDIGVSYSLSTIISTLPGAFLVGTPLASFLHLYLATIIFDVSPKPTQRQSAYFWGAQLFIYGLLLISVCVADKQARVICKAFWSSEHCDYATASDDLAIFMAPNMYIIFFMACFTILVVLGTSGVQLCTCKFSRHRSRF